MEHEDHRANPFAQTSHDKADAAIDHARQVREKKIADLGEKKPGLGYCVSLISTGVERRGGRRKLRAWQSENRD
jgi:hypothetical protein